MIFQDHQIDGCAIHDLNKFSQDRLGASVIDEVQARIARLRPPRGFSIRPVLIHASSVTPAVSEAEFFASIVDVAALMFVPEKSAICR